MTSPLTIRRATGEDLPWIMALLTETSRWLASIGSDQWQRPTNEDRLATSIAAGTVWIASRDSHKIATLTVDDFADPEFWTEADRPQDALYVHRIAIARQAAGQGIGTTLLDWAASRAAAAGRPWLRLDAWATNERLHAYYISHGWTHVRTVRLPHRGSGALFQRPTGGAGSALRVALSGDPSATSAPLPTSRRRTGA